MPITIKTEQDIKVLREGGSRLAAILGAAAKLVKPGVSAKYIDDFVRSEMEKGGDSAAFLGYKPKGAKRPYPASVCVSINDAIVHGIPNEGDITFKEGDIVGVDAGLKHKNLFTDMALTVPVGEIHKKASLLIKVTKDALQVGIKAARSGNTTGDVGYAIQRFVRPYGFGIIRGLSGHGVGYEVHEDPYVPNYGEAGKGEVLKSGMVIAIEPMLSLGSENIVLDRDGYTYKTADGSISAHFEHTILITEGEAEILTKM